MQSYAENGQDVHLLTKVYPSSRRGYFVDVGAYDGVEMSNTLLLEQNGWKGLCIEPHPRAFDKLIRSRRCVCSPFAAFNVDDSEISLSADPVGDQSTIVINETTGTGSFPIIKIPTKKLSTLLRENGAPAYIEYLSIDTEGSEYDILSAHDFTLYRFGYVCVDWNADDTNRQRLKTLLESKGYTLARSIGQDDEYKWMGKRGVLMNLPRDACSVYETGVQVYNTLRKSNAFHLEYCERFPFEYVGYDFVIVNGPLFMAKNNWARPQFFKNIGKVSFAIVTEMGLDDTLLDARTLASGYDFYIVLDPSINSVSDNKTLIFPRPLDSAPDTTVGFSADSPIVIGSFGFPTWGKRWDLIVEQVNKEFDVATVRFNIPNSRLVSDSQTLVEAIKSSCLEKITKPGITLEITSLNMSKHELVNWCAQNTVNCFLYSRDQVYTCGLASAADQAISSGRPLLVTGDKTFRHIHPYLPVFPDIDIRAAIATTQPGVEQMREAWSSDAFLARFEAALGGVF